MELLLLVEVEWYGLESRVAPVSVTPRSSLHPSPSEWIPPMPTGKVLAQEPITMLVHSVAGNCGRTPSASPAGCDAWTQRSTERLGGR